MKLARQLLSKAISQEYIDKSPSSYLKNHVLSFAKSIGDINANTLKKTDTGERLHRYETSFRNYYDNEIIRSLCAGKDSSFTPIIEINGAVFKQSQSPISALPERFEFKIYEPEQDEVSRNTFPDESDVKLASYDFQNIIHFTEDFEASFQNLVIILKRNFEENSYIRINFISSSRTSNQYVIDFKVNDLKKYLEEAGLSEFKKFISRYSFDVVGIRLVDKTVLSNSQKTFKAQPKALVVFIDSLDKRIFTDNKLLDRLPNFKKLIECSDHYENFVSSGDWTYPVMHSVFYGISPAISFSIFRTYTPNFYSKNHKNKFSNASSFITYVQSMQPQIFTCVNSESHLFSKLKRDNVGIYSIRQSSNLSWLYSLTSQGSITLEKNQCATDGFKKLSAKDDLTNHLVWVDLDDLHKLDMPLSNTSLNKLENNYEFDMPSSSNDKLYSKTNSSDQQIYLEKVCALDKKLGELVNMVEENIPVIIFSDHGSKAYSTSEDTTPGTLSPSRIYNPTLLVSCSRTSKRRTITSIIESQDIHQLLLNLCKVKSISHSAINFQIPEFYSYFNSSDSNFSSYENFVESIKSRKFVLTMGSNIKSNGDVDIECILTRSISNKLTPLKVSTSFSNLIKTASLSNKNDQTISKSFYKNWIVNGLNALVKTSLKDKSKN